MKQSPLLVKHLLCVLLGLGIFIAPSCHKEHGHANVATIDSMYIRDSVMRDSIVGRFWCQSRFSYMGASSHGDTLLGYDTVTVARGPQSVYWITVNGEAFCYDTSSAQTYPYRYYNVLADPYNKHYVSFSAGYDSIHYQYNGSMNSDSSWQYYYAGGRIP